MLDIDLIIDAYGLTHNVEGIRWRFGHLIPDLEDLKLIEEAAGRGISIEYPAGVHDGGKIIFTGEKEPGFDFQKFLDWVEENQEEIREKVSKK